MTATIHIIGAGLAGLSAALKLTARGEHVVVHEATAFAGGRCRSYHDASVGMTIDNGNHLLLSGNRAALDYLRGIGAERLLIGPPGTEFPFVDLASRERWTLRFNDGRVPWWIFDSARRVPGTRAFDYAALLRLLWPPADKTVGDIIACKGVLYWRLVAPLLLAALNIDPPQGSAKLASAVIRETLAAGGLACRPLIAREGLSATLIEPALAMLQRRGAAVRLEHQLRALSFGTKRVDALDFGGETIALAADDAVILAVPPYAAASLIRGLDVPTEFRAIVNAHFRIEPPADQPPILGVLNGTVEWIFAFPGRLSVTISAGDRLIDTPREELAKTIWAEVASVTGLPAGVAALANRARAPRHFCRNAGAGCQASRRRDRVAQPRSGRRLDEYRLARHHRRRDPIRQPRRRTHRAARSEHIHMEAKSTSIGKIEAATQALLACQRADGHFLFELEADATIPAEYVLLRHYLGEPVDAALESKNRRLSAPHPGRHGGWPLFRDGDFDMSATVKAYFALKMIGDEPQARAYAPRPRGDPHARRRRAGQCVHALPARALRHRAVARGAGDAGRDHAAAELVSVPPRQDFLLEPHRDRAAPGADGEEAARTQCQGRHHRRAVSRSAAIARADAAGAAAEGVVVLVLPRRRQAVARGGALLSRSARVSAPSIAPSPGSASD